MSQLLETSAETVNEAYQSVRTTLAPEEQLQFDKAMELMRSTSQSNSSRLRALDAALTLGMSAVTLHPLALEQLIIGTLTVLAKCILASHSLKSDPRMNQ